MPRKKYSYKSPLDIANVIYPSRLLKLNDLHSIEDINLTSKK